ncbi:addiction module antidote protein [Crenothrix sp.]|uniref:addiction module antidote protein n=1 Tax=Crenothrix sp. TaxID=3100433 RepID=UPI00374D776F
MVKISTVNYDPADYLTTPEAVREYLQAALEEGDVNYFLQALADAARSKGMAQTVESSDLEDINLFKSLCTDKHPQFETVFKVLAALDMRLHVA